MADRKISALTALASANVDVADLLAIVDVSEAADADKNKKITVGNLRGAINTPGGISDGQFEYNNGGVLGGTAGMEWDDVNARLALGPAYADAKAKLHASVTTGYTTHTDPSGGTTTSAYLLAATLSDTAATSPFVGLSSEVSATWASDPGADVVIGLRASSVVPSGSTALLTAVLRGGEIWTEHKGTGRVLALQGAYLHCNNSAAATVDLAWGAVVQVINASTGTMSTVYGLAILAPTNAGTMTAQYGLYLDSLNVGTQTFPPHAINQAGAGDTNFFAGRCYFGLENTYTASPQAPVDIRWNPTSSNAAGEAALRAIVGPASQNGTVPAVDDFVAAYCEITSSAARGRIWGLNTLCVASPGGDGTDAEIISAEFDITNAKADAPDFNTALQKIGVHIAAGSGFMNTAALSTWSGGAASAWRYGWVIQGVGNSVAGSAIAKTYGFVTAAYGFDFLTATFSTGALRVKNNTPVILARNAANSADINVLDTNASDGIEIGPYLTIDSTGNVRATSFTGSVPKIWVLQQDPGQPTAAETPVASRVLKTGISSPTLTVNGATTGSSCVSDSTGQYIQYTSGTSANSEAGWEFPTAAPSTPIMQFQWNSISEVVLKTGTDISQQRLYVGWFSADPMAADVTNSIHAMAFRLSVTMVGSITITNAGTGYTTPPTVAINGGTFVTQATATALMGVGALTLTNAGSGYTNGTYTAQPMTGGGGTGATFDFVVSGGVVQTTAQNAASMVVNQPGTGYTTTPTCDFSAAFGTGATGTSTLKLVNHRITAGSGYTVNPTSVSYSGGGGASAAGTAVMGGSWHCLVGNGTAQVMTDALTLAAADTRYVLRIDASGGTTVKFYINGTLVATASANLPGASTSLAFYGELRITSTNARSIRLSSLKVNQE